MQRDLFPAASGLPTPAQRAAARDAAASNYFSSFLLYVAFALVPGTVCALGVAVGENYGASAYRFVVSWLYFGVAEVLTIDPFVTRYRRQLMDVVHHWRRLFKCTQTILFVCFDHGLMYYVLLWTLSYAFVFLEAALLLFGRLTAAVEVVSILFAAAVTVFQVLWLGRIAETHGLIVAARAQPPPSNHLSQQRASRPLPLPPPPIPSGPAPLPPLPAGPPPLPSGPPPLPSVPWEGTTSPQVSPPQCGMAGRSGRTSACSDDTVRSLGSPDHEDIVEGLTTVHLGGGLEVRVDGMNGLHPDLTLDGDAHLDLVEHLRRNRLQMTVDHNTLTVESRDGATPCCASCSSYELYRCGLWGVLGMLGVAALALAPGIRDMLVSSQLFPKVSPLVEFGVLGGLVAVVLLVSGYGSRRFADPTFLQLFLLLNTTLPATYGRWILSMYAEVANKPLWPTLVLAMHLVLAQLYLEMTRRLVERLSAPGLYTRMLMLPQLLAYLFQYMIFGFTPWSTELIAILVATSIHNVLLSTGLYADAWHICRRGFTGHLPEEESPTMGFTRLMETRQTMLLFAQDTIADVWSLCTLAVLVIVLWLVSVPVEGILPNFRLQPLALRITVLLAVRTLAWVCGQLIFRRRLRSLPPLDHGTLSGQLDAYLQSLALSAFQTARIRACYEDDVPEIFADIHAMPDAVSVGDVLMLQIAERQWLLHPAVLRKYFIYFHACMYFLLFIVLHAAVSDLPLRYAWLTHAKT